MPNQAVFRRPFRRRGQNWLVPTKPSLADVIGSGGVLIGGAGTVFYSQQVGSATGAGGVEIGGSATVQFVHAPQVDSDITVEWDFDNDGDFSEAVETITSKILSLETFTGRDWPSLLTGKAGPGKLRMTLRNDDDRFNYFNNSSPLVASPFSLKTGRKVRVRTSDAGNPDPTLLVKDRFRRSAGALGSTENSLSYTEPLTDDFTISANRAVATGEGDPHIAVVDTGSADYYVQIKVSVLGDASPQNRVGIVYRYVDSDDYSLALVNGASGAVELVDVVAGTETLIAGQSIETYSGITIGVLVADTTVTLYLEGVELFSATAINTTAELVGLYAEWVSGDARPEIDEFYGWDTLPTTETGILWTGDVSELVSNVEAGPEKIANVSGEGWLARMSSQQITPQVSIEGRKTGILMGNILARSLLAHPPGVIDEGNVTTGTYAVSQRSSLSIARDIEETEFGFLYETQEGYVSFRDRSHRDSATSQVTFTDQEFGGLTYHRIVPYDWRKEVFNRVLAGISPWTAGVEATLFTDPGPYNLASGEMQTLTASYSSGLVMQWTGHTRDVSVVAAPTLESATTDVAVLGMSFSVNLPATVDENDLLLVAVSSPVEITDHVPSGWTLLKEIPNRGILIGKVADGSEDGSTLDFASVNNTGWAANIYRISGWAASLDGIEVGTLKSTSGTAPDALAINPSWGAVPTLYITMYVGFGSSSSQTSVPSGYSNGIHASGDAGDNSRALVGSASRTATVTSEDPGAFVLTGSPSLTSFAIAVKGTATTTQVTSSEPSGTDPTFAIQYDNSVGGTVQAHSNIQVTGIPLVEGDQAFAQVDDYDSQEDHNAILAYQNSANLFATSADAEAYANLVLETFADDRPILAMSFYATKSPAYRKQAVERRVGDKITLVANNNSGLGISQDFFIESINHRFTNGNRLWEVTWELSPA